MVSQSTLNEVFFVLGILFIVGAYRRWRWLVDPPIEWSLYYSQAAMRHRFGKTFTLYFTYFLGSVFAVVGGTGIYRVDGPRLLKLVCPSCVSDADLRRAASAGVAEEHRRLRPSSGSSGIKNLYSFLVDLHRHPVTMGARLVFVFAGAALLFYGVVMIYGCFQPPLRVQERAWWQKAYPPPVSRPFSYPVRVFFVLMGVLYLAIGLPFFCELFVK